MFANAKYELKKMHDSYSKEIYGEKVDYDLIFNLHMVKDNILYTLTIPFDSWYDKKYYPFTKTKVSGNYEGEKILRIYNDRILKTDKGFYEIARYSGDDGPITTTFKIDLLSKYYDEVLTFTYEYVVLKDYTLIPIDDVMINRNKKYQTSFYVDRFEEKKNVFVE